jgi:MFS family permease
MAGFAFLTHNLMIGSVFGSYGVLIPAIEAKLRLSRDVSSLGIPLVMLVIALGAPLIGGMLGRHSLRRLMMVGAALMIAGFALLALGLGVIPFLLAYALLLGPAMSLNSAMIPTTLVTRWFDARRGRALGFVNMPLLAAFMPPLLATVLTRGGLSAAYALMAAMGALLLLLALFVIDYPPRAARPTGPEHRESASDEASDDASNEARLSNGALLRSAPFWSVVGGFAVLAMSASVLSAHVVPLAMGWGVEPTRAATLLSFSSIGGMAGSAAWGWIAERLGGARVLAILCLCAAALWLLLLTHPDYLLLSAIAGLMGFTTGPVVPISSLALSQIFGGESFSRAYGLCNLLNLPALVLGVPIAAHIYVTTGSYTGAMVMMTVLGLVGSIGVLVAGRRRHQAARPQGSPDGRMKAARP